ncbi:hypothetical protein F5Y19DRAFT_474135 [Xylariaceae sp. FL1651]|nr:hypothetical protein F5Y19DRAFT_474135 [Xylariaceae sp. FL1651]
MAEAGSDYVTTPIVGKVRPSITVEKSTNRIPVQDGQPGALGDAPPLEPPLEESEGMREKISIDSSSENHVYSEHESRKVSKADISYILGDLAKAMRTLAVFTSTAQTIPRPPFGTMAFNCTLPLTTQRD